MSGCTIGTAYSYIYNTETKRLSSKNGEDDEFIKFFNGEIEAKDTKELNCLDNRKKAEIQQIIKEDGKKTANKWFVGNEDNQYEISWIAENVDTAKTCVEKKFTVTAITGTPLTSQELSEMRELRFKTREHKTYNAEENSLNIAVGDAYSIGKGYTLLIEEDTVRGIGYGKDAYYDDYLMHLVGAMNAFVRFVDQQWTAGMIDDEDMPYLLRFLREIGVDIEHPFLVNETRCEVRDDGRIQEVGNTYGIPSSYYEKAMKRYEEAYYQPLSQSVYAKT